MKKFNKPSLTSGDEELLCLYAEGNIQAFNTLYARYSVSIYNYLNTKLGNAAIAEELAQNLWVKVIDKQHEFQQKIQLGEPPFHFKSYFYSMANNLAIDHFRQASTRHEETLPESEDGDDPWAGVADDCQHEPESQLYRFQLIECVESKLNQMKAQFKETFLMTRDNKLSYEEAAVILGVSVETIKSRVKTTLQAIKPCLGAAA